MQTATQSRPDIFRISGSEAEWHVERNGETSIPYATKEAAFEAAVAAASNAIRNGHEVVIVVPGVRRGESLLGGEDTDETPWSSLT
ncbi:DUF2188 domain-containing protein [Ancylobacter mangrovi]|uniref:DUF2188 domain-containing protein n=1 Tax=Ancylobacter mangrovi TaxID=2972472 RepID=UPI0021634A72|nr:DUF2188 domain-containing protein [Ancylobacter mangrovi]MCS0501233.1 DUF2188 domain-containing protein [Ancylobacter mangrovi]